MDPNHVTDTLAERPDSSDGDAHTGSVGGGAPRPGGRAAERTRRLIRQFMKFGIVGASGVVVNAGVVVVANKTTQWLWGHDGHEVFANLLGTDYNIRWYHVFSTLAFVVANLWNFNLNRRWTFQTAGKSSWFKEMFSFMLVGAGGLVVTLMVQTAMINPESPIHLSREFFDGSTGLRDPIYWGNLIGVIVAIPVNFLINKVWTFRAARDHRVATHVTPLPEDAPADDDSGSTDNDNNSDTKEAK
ncbi:MAG TPA: GtrA family protein [Candidatus Corynebacterium avicola]|uniref:GtrA family protein n=1 Tax=Candidatus Corynebacterium avicola TaxID=2838527 RepID=A0A9D1RQX6_9CORY|nr:GtrA family protein [Candidatus Corynebacterium avicola]